MIDEKAIIPAIERFPMAQAPGASSDVEVFEAWRARGLIPRELTEAETVQRIVITHDPLNGQLKWTISPNMDGLMATLLATNTLALMPALVVADAAVSIAEYFTTGEGRADLGTGEAAVMIAFRNGRLAVDSLPANNKTALRKLLATTLMALLAADDGHPLEGVLADLAGK